MLAGCVVVGGCCCCCAVARFEATPKPARRKGQNSILFNATNSLYIHLSSYLYHINSLKTNLPWAEAMIDLMYPFRGA